MCDDDDSCFDNDPPPNGDGKDDTCVTGCNNYCLSECTPNTSFLFVEWLNRPLPPPSPLPPPEPPAPPAPPPCLPEGSATPCSGNSWVLAGSPPCCTHVNWQNECVPNEAGDTYYCSADQYGSYGP